jgi:DNA repair exonuclease SbcCD ATPase subunit
MKIYSLSIDNFLTIGNACLQLASKGLNLIDGVNDEDSSATSNGAGKSSVVDALCWCLHGVTARGAKGDAIVNNVAKKGTCVQIQMGDEVVIYRVTRYRKHPEHKNQLRIEMRAVGTSNWADLSKGTEAETQKVVDQALGCTYEVFVAAVYAGQEKMPDLPNMTDAELKRTIEEAAGMRRLERAFEIAKSRRTAAVGAHSTAEDKLTVLQARKLRIETDLVDVEARMTAWADGRKTMIDSAGLIVEVTHEKLRTARVAVGAWDPTRIELEEQKAKIDVELAEHSKKAAAVKAASDAAAAADRAIDRAKLSTATSAVASLQKDLDNAPAAMAKPCGECGKAHTADELETFTAHLKKRLSDAQLTLGFIKIAVTEQAKTAVAAKKAAEKAASELPDVSTLAATRRELEKRLGRTAELAAAVERTMKDHEAAKVTLAHRKAEPNPDASLHATLTKQLAEIASELGGAQANVDKLLVEREVAEDVVKVFGPAGVRAQILDTVTPYLNTRTAHYLSALSDGNMVATWTTLTKNAKGELREKFSIEVELKTGGDSFTLLSGGEKRKARLACALALQDLVASRAAKPIELWIGDEIDAALDPAGLERLMGLLELKARDHGTVIVISHNDMKDWIDRTTTVTKGTDGISTVAGAMV